MSCSSISSSSLIACPPCHPQLSCSVSTEGSEGGGRKQREEGGGASLHPWQPVWLACSSLDDTGCCCSLLGLHNPLDCCIKTITWFFAPFQLYNIASLLEEAINNKEGRLRGREMKDYQTRTQHRLATASCDWEHLSDSVFACHDAS